MARHKHKYTIADRDAVQLLMKKVLAAGPAEKRRERLLRAVDEVQRRYMKADQKERQAFLHGLLTGYAVALKLW